MTKINTIYWSFFFFLFIQNIELKAQIKSLSIDTCVVLAKQYFPMIARYGLLDRQIDYSIKDVNKGNFPRLYIKGQASYQSEVVKIPFNFPNIEIPTVSKDQYKIYGELIQPLTDLYVISEKKGIIEASGEVARSKIDIKFHELKNQVTQLFFSILLLDAQLVQVKSLKDDLHLELDQVQTSVNQGVALKKNIDMLQASLLKIEQQFVEVESNRKKYASMLGLLINQSIDETTSLEHPTIVPLSSTVDRPELQLFHAQQKIASIEYKFIGLKNLPRFSLFFRGGYGRPALNLLNNDFSPYYMGGIKFSWAVSNLYTRKDEQQQLTINQKIIAIEQETFMLKTKLELTQHKAEIEKYKALIAKDEKIIKIKERIKKISQTQFKNGSITVNDYLLTVHDEDRAKQSKILHQVKLLKNYYDHQLASGN